MNDLAGRTVGLDTAPVIFFIEQRKPYVDVLRPFFDAVNRGDKSIVTSTITLLEVLVHPIRNGDFALARQYNDILLNSPNIHTIPVTPATAQLAAELRAEGNLKTPDAIHLATAIQHQAESFLTNDRDYGQVQQLHVLRVSEL